MPVGSKWQLFIPSELAYGASGGPGGGIGPNATLVFEVELMSIQPKAEVKPPKPNSTPTRRRLLTQPQRTNKRSRIVEWLAMELHSGEDENPRHLR